MRATPAGEGRRPRRSMQVTVSMFPGVGKVEDLQLFRAVGTIQTAANIELAGDKGPQKVAV